MVHNALLNLRCGIAGGNRFVKTGQVIHAGDQNILHATIAQLIQNTEPELGGFVFADPNAQYIFLSVQVDSQNHVGGFIDNLSILIDLEVDGIQKDYGVNVLQRSVLPFLDHGHDFIGDIGDERRGDIHAVKLLEMVLNLAGANAPGIEGNNLVFDAGNVLLMLLHNDRFKFAVSVTGYGQFHIAVFTADCFGGVSIATVAGFYRRHRFCHTPVCAQVPRQGLPAGHRRTFP